MPRFPRTPVKGGKRKDLGGKYFRSSWEANWARYLQWLQDNGGIKSWEYEPETFEFPVKKGSKYYTPDFRVVEDDDSVVRHEVKGYMDQPSRTKLKRMAKYHPDIVVRVVDRKAYNAVASQFKRWLPNWEVGGLS
jgi:hypothetical protein